VSSTAHLSSRRAIAAIGLALGELKEQVVFVGGTVTALYRLESGLEIRPTDDVDCIVNVLTLSDYYAFSARLRERGFTPCSERDAPICRYEHSGIAVDIVPVATTPVGPTNRWYADALRDAVEYESEGVFVRAITPIYFIATKLEAFKSRGRNDYVESHDLENILTVLAGLEQLRELIESASSTPAYEVRLELLTLARNEDFQDALSGHFPGHPTGQGHARVVRAWLRTLKR
jgi:predicted nucleotidyltransferase